MDLIDVIMLLVAVPIGLLFAGLICIALGIVLLVAVVSIGLVLFWAFLKLLRMLFVSIGDKGNARAP